MTWTFWSCISSNSWVESSNLCVSSGEFGMSFVSLQSLPSFAHRVEIERMARGVVELHPTEGEAWALYNTWDKNSGSQNEATKTLNPKPCRSAEQFLSWRRPEGCTPIESITMQLYIVHMFELFCLRPNCSCPVSLVPLSSGSFFH
jgi:hypothetical protein